MSRLSTGIDGLDERLGGGLMPGTLTVVVGSTGIGKTQFGLQFAHAGLNQEQHAGAIFDMTARGDSQSHVYHQILRKDPEWVARDLFRQQYRAHAEWIARHGYDPAAIGCLLLYTAHESTLDALIERPLDDGDLLSNANTVIYLGKIRDGSRFRRAIYVAKHRGSACSDDISPYTIDEQGIRLE